MQTAVFDEYLVGMHAGDNYSSQVDSGPLAFQSVGIAAGPKCNVIYADPCGIQKC